MRTTYHHGELRRALIDKALETLQRYGTQALSLRGLARATGVSAMAPYAHFANRTDLLAAVAAEGFRRLQDDKVEALGQSGRDPADALASGTAAYVAFVIANPALYRLMNGPEFADRTAYPELVEAAATPAASLIALVQRMMPDDTREAVSVKAQIVWGLAHGIGTLALDDQLAADAAAELAANGARQLIAGWTAMPETSTPSTPRG